VSEPEVPLASATDPNAGSPAVPSTINMPDSPIRQAAWFQSYVRLARPTLDWASVAWLVWVTIVEPAMGRSFNIPAAGMACAWCATVYGFKFAEKVKGVA